MIGLYDRAVVLMARLASLAIGAMFLIIVFDVSIRSVGYRPPAFSSATVEYLLLYFALLPAPYLVRKKTHVAIDAFVTRLPIRLRRLVESIVYLACIAVCLIFAYMGALLSIDAIRYSIIDQRSVDLPIALLYLPFPIVFTFVALEFLRLFVRRESFHSTIEKSAEGL